MFTLTALAVSLMGLFAAPQGVEAYEARLLKVGSTIPDVEVTHPGGKTVKLMSLIKGKKAAIINFWFYH